MLFLLILFSVEVFSIGLSSYHDLRPDQIDFEPNLVRTYSYRLDPTVSSTMDYSFYAEGDLAEYIFFNPPQLKNVAGNDHPWFQVILQLPSTDEGIEPGMHYVYFGVVEGSSTGGGMGTRSGMDIRLPIRVLADGKLLKATLNIDDVATNSTGLAKLQLQNWGKDNIDEASARIEIYEGENLVETITTNSTSLESASTAILEANFNTESYTAGNYNAIAYVDWDEGQLEVEEDFRVGELDIYINQIQDTMEAGKINPFTIEIESGWNDPIYNVYFEGGINGKTMKSPSTTLSTFEVENLTAYFDASGMEEKLYYGNIILYFEDKDKDQRFNVTFIAPTEKVFEVPELKEPLSLPYGTIVIVIISILVLILVIVFLMKRRKNKEGEEGGWQEPKDDDF